MSPTSSRTFLVGKNARSATLRTTSSPPRQTGRAGPGRAGTICASRMCCQTPTARCRGRCAECLCGSVARAVSRHRAHRAVPAVATALALVAAGCGGGDDQSAAEQSGSFEVDVVRTSFPAVQHLAEQAQFVAEIRNAGDRAIDNIAVTLDGFSA